MEPSGTGLSMSRSHRWMRWTFAAQLILLGSIAACGGGDSGELGLSSTLSGEYLCSEPAEGLMAVGPATVMGGRIEGRSDGSFVLVSHRLWGVQRVVLMLGPDLARQGLVSGYIHVVPESLFCPSPGGLYSNGTQFLNGKGNGSNIYLKLKIDPEQGVLSGTLRDYGGDGTAVSVKGGPIVGTRFNPAQPSSIGAARGDWTLSDAAGRSGALSVGPDGGLQLKLAECSYSGWLLPVSGLNLLALKLRAQPGCLFDTYETEGFVVLLPLADGRQQLMLWGVDDGWGLVAQAIGRR